MFEQIAADSRRFLCAFGVPLCSTTVDMRGKTRHLFIKINCHTALENNNSSKLLHAITETYYSKSAVDVYIRCRNGHVRSEDKLSRMAGEDDQK